MTPSSKPKSAKKGFTVEPEANCPLATEIFWGSSLCLIQVYP